MAGRMDPGGPANLERSCGPTPRDRLWLAPPSHGIERLEAWFSGHAYDRHRHDTYAIGITHRGVQAFAYRGGSHASTPGQVIVLHPDEAHDGHAGSEAGFGYRMLYVEPRAIRAALDAVRSPLPFVPEAVAPDPRLAAAIAAAFRGFPGPLDELEADQLMVGLADGLLRRDPARRPVRSPRIAVQAVDRVRACLDAEFAQGVSSRRLEALSGLDRFALARHFRARLGTSPYRYLVMRRLDEARKRIAGGVPLAEAALAAGFADQSHLTRHFKQTFGLPPGRFARLARS